MKMNVLINEKKTHFESIFNESPINSKERLDCVTHT